MAEFKIIWREVLKWVDIIVGAFMIGFGIYLYFTYWDSINWA